MTAARPHTSEGEQVYGRGTARQSVETIVVETCGALVEQTCETLTEDVKAVGF